MLKRYAVCLLLLAPAIWCGKASAQTEQLPLKLSSPDGQLAITVALNNEGAVVYSVAYRNQPVIVPSALGLEFKAGGPLSKHLRVVAARRDAHDEAYPLVVGKARQARDHYNELIVSLEESEAPQRKLDLIFRAYDDGAAFRYRLPAQDGLNDFAISAERSEFRFPTDLPCWALHRDSFSTSYEGEYDRITLNRIGANAIIGLPLVVQSRDESITVALAEADLDDYAGLYFTGLNNGYGVMSRLSPRKDDASIAVRGRVGRDGFRTPWRVIMVAGQPGKLIESTLIMNLNPPSAVSDTSWIRPGRAAWDWWSGPVAAGVKQVGMNNETMRYYIDFASEFGLEYMLIDAGWYTPVAWGPNADLKADITKTVPAIDLPALVEYARSRNVGIWVWLNWVPANNQMETAFPYYERLGIKGVKVDFMDRDDQEMVAFYHRILKTAAAHHLMVDLHGAYKPTGLARTYPNYVTQEGVMGAEYNKWSARVTATHNLTLPFTRMLLGPMDYTPGGFRNATRQTFEIHNTGPQVMTTRAQQLAMYVVYESPFACVSDSPDAYRGQAGSEFLKVVPTSWDETRVLAGEIGQYIVVARRHGNDWYLAAMNNEQPREVAVPGDFLGDKTYYVTTYADGPTPTDIIANNGVRLASKSGDSALHLRLVSGGGFVQRYRPK